MRSYKLYIFDLDGTLYRGGKALPHAVDTVRELRSRGSLIRYLTNNSGQTRSSYVEKLRGLGFDVEPTEVYSSAIATAEYCQEVACESLFVIGEPGLIATLLDAGLNVVNASLEGSAGPEVAAQAEAVAVGIHRQFSYEILNTALQQILGGARFIATNADATYPVEEGRLIPGAGAIVSAVQTCSGVEPYVIGKPNPFMVELVLKDAAVSALEALVVGDRYETDIESGVRAGVDTHLVLTGVTKQAPEGQSSSEDLRSLL